MFMSRINGGQPIGQESEALSRFDLLGGAEAVELVARRLAALRKRLSHIELGVLAGVGVLDQYRAATARIDLRWWKRPTLALAGLYGLIAIGLPLLGFVASLAIDVAVFGGAADSLIKASPIYAAFAVGSLVFAAGLGIAPAQYKRPLMIVMMIACLGASMVAADNPGLRNTFSNWLPMLKSQANGHEQALAELNRQANGITEAIRNKQMQVEPPGRPILLDDGTKDNDEIARQLYREISALNDDLVGVKKAAGREQVALQQSQRENWAQYLGRIIGGVYIFCWLVASQFVIAVVIEMAAGKLDEQRARATAHEFARKFVDQVDARDRVNSRALVVAAVSDMLVRRFSPILTEEAAKDADKTPVLEQLFEEETFEQMRKIGVDLVCKTLVPRHGHIMS